MQMRIQDNLKDKEPNNVTIANHLIIFIKIVHIKLLKILKTFQSSHFYNKTREIFNCIFRGFNQ